MSNETKSECVISDKMANCSVVDDPDGRLVL